jgi:hypothetical protein
VAYYPGATTLTHINMLAQVWGAGVPGGAGSRVGRAGRPVLPPPRRVLRAASLFHLPNTRPLTQPPPQNPTPPPPQMYIHGRYAAAPRLIAPYPTPTPPHPTPPHPTPPHPTPPHPTPPHPTPPHLTPPHPTPPPPTHPPKPPPGRGASSQLIPSPRATSTTPSLSSPSRRRAPARSRAGASACTSRTSRALSRRGRSSTRRRRRAAPAREGAVGERVGFGGSRKALRRTHLAGAANPRPCHQPSPAKPPTPPHTLSSAATSCSA